MNPNPSPRKLTRSRDQRMIAGVCGGVAQYLNMDPTLVRVLFVAITALTAGTVGIIAYVAAVLVVPEEVVVPPGQIPTDQTSGPVPYERMPYDEPAQAPMSYPTEVPRGDDPR